MLDHFGIACCAACEVYEGCFGDGWFGSIVDGILRDRAEGCAEVDDIFGRTITDLDDVFERRAVVTDSQDFLHADRVADED